MEGLIKIGPWGGRGGDPRDDIAAVGVAPHRLESVVIRAEGAVDAFSFVYAGVDGVKFGPTEVVKEISGTYGPYGGHAGIVRSLTFVTNAGKHGPFGEAAEGTPFSVPVQDGGRIVGFFGRSGSLLDAVAVYVHP
nr:unnamed protein product [Digitaria exilis]